MIKFKTHSPAPAHSKPVLKNNWDSATAPTTEDIQTRNNLFTKKEEATKTKNKKRRKSDIKIILVPLICAILGLSLVLYPVLATRHNNERHREIAREFKTIITQVDPKKAERALKRADKYNKDLSSGKLTDPFFVDIVPDSREYKRYLEQLNIADIMGVVTIPSVNINLPIYHGTSDKILKQGVGHLFGSSLPVGGRGTHAVLTGHSGLAEASMFDNLPKVKIGDKIYISVAGRDMQYVVKDITVVLPEETDSLKRQRGRDLITLITCTPYGINSHRLFVTAEREFPVNENALKAGQEASAPWETWMIVLVLLASFAALLFGTTFIRLFILWRRRRKKEEEEKNALPEFDPDNMPQEPIELRPKKLPFSGRARHRGNKTSYKPF